MRDQMVGCLQGMIDAVRPSSLELDGITTALHDDRGAILIQSAGPAAWADIPGACVARAIALRGRDGFAAGALFHIGGSDSPDSGSGHATILAPALASDRLIGFASASLLSRYGRLAGSSALLRIAQGDGPRWDVVDDLLRWYSHVKFLSGRLPSMFAACRAGVVRLQALARSLGPDRHRLAWQRRQDESEAGARAAVARIADGVYRARPGSTVIDVGVEGDSMRVSLCVPAAVATCGLRSAAAGARAAFAELVLGAGPLDAGSFRALAIDESTDQASVGCPAAQVAEQVAETMFPAIRHGPASSSAA